MSAVVVHRTHKMAVMVTRYISSSGTSRLHLSRMCIDFNYAEILLLHRDVIVQPREEVYACVGSRHQASVAKVKGMLCSLGDVGLAIAMQSSQLLC